MDGAGSLWCSVAGNAARERELSKKPLHPGLILRDSGIQLAVATLQMSIRHHCRPAVARAGNINHVEIVLVDDAVHVHINKIQTGGGAPVAEQTRLDVRNQERFFQQRIIEKVNLSYRKIVGSTPIGVHPCEFFDGSQSSGM